MGRLPTVGRNVSSTPTAHRSLLASTNDARTLVLVFAASMLTVGSETTYPSVFATKGTKETHSTDATESQRSHRGQKSLTPAILLLVASMQFAMRGQEQLLVNVFLVFGEIPMLSANLSARSTKSVPLTWLVSLKSAKTLVLECVDLLPLALSGITIQTVSVILATPEIPSELVPE